MKIMPSCKNKPEPKFDPIPAPVMIPERPTSERIITFSVPMPGWILVSLPAKRQGFPPSGVLLPAKDVLLAYQEGGGTRNDGYPVTVISTRIGVPSHEFYGVADLSKFAAALKQALESDPCVT